MLRLRKRRTSVIQGLPTTLEEKVKLRDALNSNVWPTRFITYENVITPMPPQSQLLQNNCTWAYEDNEALATHSFPTHRIAAVKARWAAMTRHNPR
jgi:hypothetical protein